jgi:hypothetical protein
VTPKSEKKIVSAVNKRRSLSVRAVAEGEKLNPEGNSFKTVATILNNNDLLSVRKRKKFILS